MATAAMTKVSQNAGIKSVLQMPQKDPKVFFYGHASTSLKFVGVKNLIQRMRNTNKFSLKTTLTLNLVKEPRVGIKLRFLMKLMSTTESQFTLIS
jgi:hypothetical protein